VLLAADGEHRLDVVAELYDADVSGVQAWSGVDGAARLAGATVAPDRRGRSQFVAARQLALVAGVPTLLGTDGDRVVIWTRKGETGWDQAKPAGFDASDEVTGLAALGARRVVVGARGATPLAWFSDDGRTFTSATSSSFQGGEIHGLASRPGALVAWGRIGERSVTWTSLDGEQWSTPVPFDEGTDIGRIAGGGASFVATGSSHGRALAFASPDGRAWKPVPAADLLAGGGRQSGLADDEGRIYLANVNGSKVVIADAGGGVVALALAYPPGVAAPSQGQLLLGGPGLLYVGLSQGEPVAFTTAVP